MEVHLDPIDKTILGSDFTTKKLLLQRSGGDGTIEAQTPLRTNKGRPQFVQSNCRTLHKLLSLTKDFMKGKSLIKMQTYIDFAGHRSSQSFRQVVLSQHGLEGGGCFDLVEDVVTGAIRGYLPAGRRCPEYNQTVYDYKPVGDGMKSSVSPIVETDWVTSLLRHFSANNKEEDYHHFPRAKDDDESESDNIIQHPRKWTALDWMDWSVLQQQKASASIQEEVVAQDWLSYVDLNQRHKQTA